MSTIEPVISRDEILCLRDDNFVPDNVCIVTGAGSGIGRATAVAASANGLTVVGLDIDQEAMNRTKETCQALGGHFI